MITIIPFRASHAYIMTRNIKGEFVRAMEQHEKDESSLTALYNKQFLCSGGVKIIWKGVGEAWTVNSPLVKEHPMTFHKLILKWLNLFMEKYDLQRVQAVVENGNDTYIKWIESLGFIKEGLMKKYHMGLDYFMYAKVR